MAFNVSAKYRQKVYSGGAINRATLTINGNLIPNSNIKRITITSPIIDTTQEYFYIGTFIAQKVEIEFKNANDIDLNGVVLLSIDTKTDDEEFADEDGFENVDIGQYYIDTTPEDYYKMAKITCYDKSILFKQNVDISKWLDENGEITAEELLKRLCEYFLGENMLGTYPSFHKDLKTSFYDNTKSGKFYMSQIAEIMACNVKLGRDGKLYLVPLKRSPMVTINALKSKSWEILNKYRISRVYYDNGENIYEAGDQSYNSLNIRIDNIFMNGTNNDIQTIVNDLYNELNGFEIYSVKNENYGDVSLDCWDLINFTLGENSYNVINDNVIVYEMNIATTINPIIPSKQKQQITNVINRENNILNIMQTEIDQANNRAIQTQRRVDEIADDFGNYYTKEELFQIIRDVETGLTTIFSNYGSKNLLVNTAPYRFVANTNTLENWDGNITYTSENQSINQMALLLLNGTASQTINVKPNKEYAIGFKYKRTSNGTNATLQINYNGRQITIDGQDNVTYNDQTNLTNINNEIKSYGVVVGDTFTISFTSDRDRAFEIYELRLFTGTNVLDWEQNDNEFKTKTVNIGDGITIDSAEVNTMNKLDTFGMVVTNKTTGEETLRATDEGIETKDLTAKGKANISGMLVQRINKKHIFITGIVEE